QDVPDVRGLDDEGTTPSARAEADGGHHGGGQPDRGRAVLADPLDRLRPQPGVAGDAREQQHADAQHDGREIRPVQGLEDVDTGRVVDAGDAHEPLQPASLTKVITALAVHAFIPADGSVPVSARAQGSPAMSMNMKAGQVWPLQEALHALLMVSANDAAIA